MPLIMVAGKLVRHSNAAYTPFPCACDRCQSARGQRSHGFQGRSGAGDSPHSCAGSSWSAGSWREAAACAAGPRVSGSADAEAEAQAADEAGGSHSAAMSGVMKKFALLQLLSHTA